MYTAKARLTVEIPSEEAVQPSAAALLSRLATRSRGRERSGSFRPPERSTPEPGPLSISRSRSAVGSPRSAGSSSELVRRPASAREKGAKPDPDRVSSVEEELSGILMQVVTSPTLHDPHASVDRLLASAAGGPLGGGAAAAVPAADAAAAEASGRSPMSLPGLAGLSCRPSRDSSTHSPRTCASCGAAERAASSAARCTRRTRWTTWRHGSSRGR